MDSKTLFQNQVIAAVAPNITLYQNNAPGFLNTYLAAKGASDCAQSNLNGADFPINAQAMSVNYNSFYTSLKAITIAANTASLEGINVSALATLSASDSANAQKAFAAASKAINTALASASILLANVASIATVLDNNDQDTPSVSTSPLQAIKDALTTMEQTSILLLNLNTNISTGVSLMTTLNTASGQASSDAQALLKNVTSTMTTIKGSGDTADKNYSTALTTLYTNEAKTEKTMTDYTAAGYVASDTGTMPANEPAYVQSMESFSAPQVNSQDPIQQ